MNNIMNIEEITVPFPPQIKPEDILEKRRQNRKSAKSPNAFFIYRIAFLDQLRLHNFRVKMTDMSGLVSTAWKKEPQHVKSVYKDLARKVERLVIDARQKSLAQQQQQQMRQLPQPIYLESQFASNLNNHNNFTPLNSNQYFNNYNRVDNIYHQPLVPSQNFSFIHFGENNQFFNENQFSPTLSDDNNFPSPIFDGAQLSSTHGNVNVEQQPYFYNNHYNHHIINENMLYWNSQK